MCANVTPSSGLFVSKSGELQISYTARCFLTLARSVLERRMKNTLRNMLFHLIHGLHGGSLAVYFFRRESAWAFGYCVRDGFLGVLFPTDAE